MLSYPDIFQKLIKYNLKNEYIGTNILKSLLKGTDLNSVTSLPFPKNKIYNYDFGKINSQFKSQNKFDSLKEEKDIRIKRLKSFTNSYSFKRQDFNPFVLCNNFQFENTKSGKFGGNFSLENNIQKASVKHSLEPCKNNSEQRQNKIVKTFNKSLFEKKTNQKNIDSFYSPSICSIDAIN